MPPKQSRQQANRTVRFEGVTSERLSDQFFWQRSSTNDLHDDGPFLWPNFRPVGLEALEQEVSPMLGAGQHGDAIPRQSR
jgi:hypothetical protein